MEMLIERFIMVKNLKKEKKTSSLGEFGRDKFTEKGVFL